MSYASMIVQVDFDTGSDNRMRLAAGLADRFGAKLIGVAAAVPQPPFVTNGAVIDQGLVEAERERIEKALNHAAERFRACAAAARAPEWRAAIDFPTDFLAASARAADLLLVGRGGRSGDRSLYDSADPGDVVMQAGRPVLVIPPAVDILHGRSVVVAWKDTREARRAISDALPLLVRAEGVLVLALDEEAADARPDLEDVAAYLRLHKVMVRTERRPAPDKPVADELIETARREDADLIVAGAYGHSRFREWVFGGATQGLLARSPVCCLMAH